MSTRGRSLETVEEVRITDSGLVAWGVVARQMATHRVEKPPTRAFNTCRLDEMGGNTMFAMHLAQILPGGFKCNHRHLDETMAVIISGRGITELRQSDYVAPIATTWQAGDVVVIPTNAWHRHINTDPDNPARQLSFRNTPLMNRLLHGDGGAYTPKDRVYNGPARFPERFNDEEDFFTRREELSPRRVRTNFIPQVVNEALPAPDPNLGEGVAVKYYDMGGQLTLNVALMGIRPSGFVRPHAPLAEESLYVLAGDGRTDLWAPDGERYTLEWSADDLVCPPLGVKRQHFAGSEEVRILRVRNVAIERALGIPVEEPRLDSSIPSRFDNLFPDSTS